MSYRELSVLDVVYDRGHCLPFSKYKAVARHGVPLNMLRNFSNAVTTISQLKTGLMEATGPPGCGKSTRFPYELSESTGKYVIVVCPNHLIAAQACYSAEVCGFGSPSLVARLGRTGRNGDGRVIYVDVELFLNQLMTGRFRPEVLFLVDESLTTSAEYEMVRGFVMLLANEHVVIQVSTQNGEESESLSAGIQVESTTKLSAVEQAGKSTLRFHASSEEAVAAAGPQGKVLLPVDGYPEYAEAYEYCRHGGVVHLPVSLAAGLNLPVDYVVSVTKQVALVVRHPELEFMKTRVDQMLAFQQAGRLCRSGKRTGVCFTDLDPKRMSKRKAELPSGERLVAGWFLSVTLNLKSDDVLYKYLDAKLGYDNLIKFFESGESWRDRFRYVGAQESSGQELVPVGSGGFQMVLSPQKVEGFLRAVAEVYCDPDGLSDDLQMRGVLGRDGRYLAKYHKVWHTYLVSKKGLRGLEISRYLVDQEAYQDALDTIVEHRNYLVAQIVSVFATTVAEGKLSIGGEQFMQRLEDVSRVVNFYGALAALVPEWVPSIVCKFGDSEVRMNGCYIVPTVKVISAWRSAFAGGARRK